MTPAPKMKSISWHIAKFCLENPSRIPVDAEKSIKSHSNLSKRHPKRDYKCQSRTSRLVHNHWPIQLNGKPLLAPPDRNSLSFFFDKDHEGLLQSKKSPRPHTNFWKNLFSLWSTLCLSCILLLSIISQRLFMPFHGAS